MPVCQVIVGDFRITRNKVATIIDVIVRVLEQACIAYEEKMIRLANLIPSLSFPPSVLFSLTLFYCFLCIVDTPGKNPLW